MWQLTLGLRPNDYMSGTASNLVASHGMPFWMAERIGRVAWDPGRRSWFLDFRWVRFPGADKPRRVRLYNSPLFGKIESKKMAEKALARIRGQLDDRALHQVLARYIELNAPENSFLRYWRLFLEEKAEDFRVGEIGAKRLSELESYERRGYLNPLEHESVFAIRTGSLEDWKRWLLRTKFQGSTGRPSFRKTSRLSSRPERRRIKPNTVRHIVADVGTFLRWLHRRGDIDTIPEIPEVKIGRTRYSPTVPSEATKDAILAAVPEPKRGLFLARSYMGLRPSEARSVAVSAYHPERGMLHLTNTKTGHPRYLPLHDYVEEWLAKYVPRTRRLKGSEPLFQNPDGREPDKRWTPASERRAWLAACRQVGVTIKPNEGGRHAFGTHAAARGLGDVRLQKYMGHADPRSTSRYITLAGEGLADVVKLTHGQQADSSLKASKKDKQ